MRQGVKTICQMQPLCRPHRAGGLNAPQIGRNFGLDYGSVSQERKRLRERLPKDRKLQALMSRIGNSLSTSEG